METQKPFYNRDVTVFAETNFRDQRKTFGVKRADRRRHMYIIGKTGMGKASMLEHMIVQDIKRSEGLCVIDTQGLLVEELLYYIPSHRLKDVIYVNPADIDYPVAFNLLETSDDLQAQTELVQGLINIFKDLWGDIWGPRLEYVLKNSLITLLADENNTLLHILLLLTDADFRRRLLAKVTDQVILDFWLKEYQESPERFDSAAILPIRDKIGQIVSTSLLRNIIGQAKTGFNFEDIIAEKKIVILVLNKSKIGDEAARLLGSVFTLKLMLAAKKMQQPGRESADVYFYLYDFQNYSPALFNELITSPNFGLNLILCNQYLEQVPELVQRDIFGNFGTIVAFRVGSSDAVKLAEVMKLGMNPEDLMKLNKYNIMLTLSIDGETSAPFTAVTLEPLPVAGLKDNVIAYSRERYSHRREEAEESIRQSLHIYPTKNYAEAPIFVEPEISPANIDYPAVDAPSAENSVQDKSESDNNYTAEALAAFRDKFAQIIEPTNEMADLSIINLSASKPTLVEETKPQSKAVSPGEEVTFN